MNLGVIYHENQNLPSLVAFYGPYWIYDWFLIPSAYCVENWLNFSSKFQNKKNPRYLIEGLTGYYTGTMYNLYFKANDTDGMRAKGYYGEGVPYGRWSVNLY